MKKKNIITISLILGGLILLAYIFSLQIKPAKAIALPYYLYNADSNQIKQTETPGLKINTFRFIDQRSDTVSDKIVKDKIYVADYFFVTCPGICKDMATQMQRLYKEFEHNSEFLLLSHTSKPEEDTPEVLMAYSKKYGVTNQDKWLFLTGNKKELYDVARSQYHIVDEKGNGDAEDFIHTERFVLVDKQGYIRGYYDGTDSLEVNKLIIDIKILSE